MVQHMYTFTNIHKWLKASGCPVLGSKINENVQYSVIDNTYFGFLNIWLLDH